jgi:hypothetical protein
LQSARSEAAGTGLTVAGFWCAPGKSGRGLFRPGYIRDSSLQTYSNGLASVKCGCLETWQVHLTIRTRNVCRLDRSAIGALRPVRMGLCSVADAPERGRQKHLDGDGFREPASFHIDRARMHLEARPRPAPLHGGSVPYCDVSAPARCSLGSPRCVISSIRDLTRLEPVIVMRFDTVARERPCD